MSNASNDLEIEVSDFGPISKARIDLRPLTVFVGPGNAGKSYLAILIYALHKFFNNVGWISGRFPFVSSTNYGYEKSISQEVIEWTKKTFNGKVRTGDDIAIPDILVDGISDMISQSNSSELEDELCRCFGISESKFLISGGNKNGAKVIIRRNNESVRHDILIGARKATIATKFPKSVQIYDQEQIEDIETLVSSLKRWETDEIHSLARAVADMVLRQVCGALIFRPFYLPADRTGIMRAHSAGALIVGAPRGAPSTAALSGVLADFLERLAELGNQPGPRSETRPDLAAPIEDRILGGSVRIRRPTGYPAFAYRPNGWKRTLPLTNASSMVSELAPLVLYLRHLVRPDDALIVEEPESHLHPGMQVEFTRQLAMIVRTGVRVIVTTHSEWILEELANLVQISELPSDARHGLPNGEMALRTDQVGAWSFEPRDGGSVVKEIRIEETGLYPSGFSRVSAALHNNWAEIRSRMGKSE